MKTKQSKSIKEIKPIIYKAKGVELPFKVSEAVANLFPGVIYFKK